MTYKVIQWATGEVGKHALRETLRNPQLELVGVRVYSEAKDGRDAGEIVGLPATGVLATRDRDALLALDADCVIHSPLSSSMQEMDDDVVALLESCKNVISTAGYYAPDVRGAEVLARIEKACAAGGTTLLGTGIEPGFMFERVAPTLTGMCADLDHIRLVESIDAARHPAAVMIKDAVGIGKPLDAVTPESPFIAYFLAFFAEMTTGAGRALGMSFDRLDSGIDVAPASRDLEIAVGSIAQGTVGGVKYWLHGYVGGTRRMTVEIHWVVEPGISGWPAPTDRYQWQIEIEGRPSARMVLDVLPTLGEPGEDYDPAFLATAATAVNAVPAICQAAPGHFHQPVFAAWQHRGKWSAESESRQIRVPRPSGSVPLSGTEH
jgi:hypothetical protein